MKISKAIETLQAIQAQFGDIAITGGYLSDDSPLREISVTNDEGMEIWPGNPNGVEVPKDGVYEVFLGVVIVEDPRIIRAQAHADTISKIAADLDTAISLAARDGYHTVLKVEGVAIGGGCFLGHGENRARIEATVTLDLMKAVR